MNWIILASILLFGLFYISICIRLILGTTALSTGNAAIRPFVSVIIPARNEESNIGSCLNAVIHQTYPQTKFEIIVVNDRSEDHTGDIVRTMMHSSSNLQCIDINVLYPKMAPKKYALQQGIASAKGDIILTTDADCRPQSGWISSMVAYFEDNVALVAGYSPLTAAAPASALSSFIALEALGLASVMAGSFGAGLPLTCAGRNLAYRKSVFQSIGGFRATGQFISGDDDLLLHLITENTNYQVRFSIDPHSVVPARPAGSFGEFSNQRIRHASKGLHYRTGLKWSLIGVYLFNLSLLSALFFPTLYPWMLLVFGLKACTEFLLVYRTARIFSQVRLLRFFPVAMFIHIPYVVIFGLWGQFGKFKWKETRYSKTMTGG
ncbi:glycosyltransferase [bacterium]|nr:glycosyltransferase [bacterium]